jgi:hypothetical protein
LHLHQAGGERRGAGYPAAMRSLIDRLRADLAAVEAELRAHRSSWAYAFAMGAVSQGGAGHPMHAQTHARTADLVQRTQALQARIAEHEV